MHIFQPPSHDGFVNWKHILVGLGLALVVLTGASVWWIYRWLQPQEIHIQNESVETIYVYGDPQDICPAMLIAGQSNAVYQDDWFLCRKPRLTFSSPLIGAIDCEWQTADEAEPVVVTDTSVSCSSVRVPVFLTPISPPSSNPRHFPTPTPPP